MDVRLENRLSIGVVDIAKNVNYSLILYLILSIAVVAGFSNTARADIPVECQTGMLPSGAIYFISTPPGWTPAGDLVVYAPGYTSPNESVSIPDISEEAITLLSSMGLAVATVNYRKTGLAVKQGVMDITELLDFFYSEPEGCGYARPAHTYLVGGSEGALVATLKVEQEVQAATPQVDGGLALCGPIGDFARQLNYFLDFRVVFDFFFPGIIPGSPVNIPGDVIDNWEDVYEPLVIAAILSSPAKTQKLLRVTRAAVDPFDPVSIVTTVVGILRYNIGATNDAIDTLGGQAFDNHDRIYFGSGNLFLDWIMNKSVARFSADASAVLELQAYYQTSGVLKEPGLNRTKIPLITSHTAADPIVPYWHEPLYRWKTLTSRSAFLHINYPVLRYGHCNFKPEELVGLLSLLIYRVTGQLPG